MMNKIAAILFAVGIAGVVAAQEGPQGPQGNMPPPPPGKECQMQKQRHPGKEMKELEKQLQGKYAKELEEIKALRQEAKKKMDLANKKFAELVKQEYPDHPIVKRAEMKQKMEAFHAKYEKELKEIKELGKTDRKAAHEKMMELFKKEGIQMPPPPPCRKEGMNPQQGPQQGCCKCQMPPPPPCGQNADNGKPMPPPQGDKAPAPAK